MDIILGLIIGGLCGLIIGGLSITESYEDRLKKGQTPFIDVTGSVSWKDPDTDFIQK